MMPAAQPLGSSANLATTERRPPPASRSWIIWCIGAVFYLTGFYHRVSPAVMTDDLMRAFGIGGAALGNLAAFYYYFYVAMQIPTGLLVDSLGARKLLIAGAFISALGAFLFGATHSFVLACVGRAIIGGSTAVAWVVLLKLATHWFPSKRFAMLTGMGLLFGNLGALGAQVPLRIAIQHFGWRPVVFGSVVFVVIVGLLTIALVRDDPSDIGYVSYAPREEKRSQVSIWQFRSIFAYKNTWLIVIAEGGLVGAILSFTGLWGGAFLRARYGLQPTTAAAVLSLMIVCWAISSPIAGALSDKIGRRKPLYVGGCYVVAAGWIGMIYIPGLPLAGFIAIAVITGLATGTVAIAFAFARESVPSQFMGTISAFVNMGNMSGPMILQPAIGAMLDKKWSGQIVHGVHVYSAAAYKFGFLLMAGWLVISVILLSMTHETNCQQSA